MLLNTLRLASCFAIAAIIACAAIAPVQAQDKETYYTILHPQEFPTLNWRAFYDRAEELTAETRKTIPNALGLEYGPDAKQKLDVYWPQSKPSRAPVFVFFHGGGNREGDRAQYGYVARPLAAKGVVTVVASYRLLPKFTHPAQVEDGRSVLAWVYRNIEEYGGDPARIYVGGHSAGSRLTSLITMRTDWLKEMKLPPDLVKGSVMVSGIATAEPRATEVPDPARREEARPLRNVVAPPPQSLIIIGSKEAHEPAERLANSEELASLIRAKGGAATLIIPEGFDHAGIVASLGEQSSEAFKAVLTMIEKPLR